MKIFILISVFTAGLSAQSTIQSIMAKSGSQDLMLVQFDVVKQELRLSSKIDFAFVRVTFDDLPNQSVTLKEIRDHVKVQPERIPRPPAK